MEKIIEVLIVDIDRSRYTDQLLGDISKQTVEPDVFLFIQDSHDMVGLNRIWNAFYEQSECKYLSFLNNDIRIPKNFIEDTLDIFEKESDVSIVVHSTNHPDYTDVTDLNYVIYDSDLCQGWDFTIRREDYVRIPDDLDTFGGDDFLFYNQYRNGNKVAVAISSPIIHYHAKSRHYFRGDRQKERDNLRKYVPERMTYYSRYSRRDPCQMV